MRKLIHTTKSHFTAILKLVFFNQKIHFSSKSYGQIIKHECSFQFFPEPTKIKSFNQTKSLHALSIIMGSFPSQNPVFIHNIIITKYASFGQIQMARKVFDELSTRNIVSYNSMIGSYCRYGFFLEAWKLFSEMRECDLKPSQFTFGTLLSCQSLSVVQGMQLHGLIVKLGLVHVDEYSGTALLGMYGRFGFSNEAVRVFEDMPCKNLVTWNTFISVLGQMGFVEDCVFMFVKMNSEMRVSEFTVLGVLSALEHVDMQFGEQVHGLVIKSGFDTVVSVSNSLINMYAKFDMTFLAERVFEKAVVKDIVSWNTLIGVMVNSEQPMKALDIFGTMCLTGLQPDERTLLNVLNCCSKLHSLSYGEYIHAKMIKKRFGCDVYNGSALVDFYAKYDKVMEAHLCFDEIIEKNLVSWNSLMLGYSNRGSCISVKLFHEMIHSGYRPNELSFSTVMKSAPRTDLLQLHSLSLKMGCLENDYVSSSLISSYTRNGLVSDALAFGSDHTTLPVVSSNVIASIYNRTGQFEKTQELYAAMEDPDTISWNILIAACSRTGDYKETFELFDHMRRSLVYPDNYTYVSLFSVCTKLCNLALGSSLHGLIMKTNFSVSDTFVRNIMIDMYGKCGGLDSCVKIFHEIVDKNLISWTALISALGLHGCGAEALEVFREMGREGFEPDKVTFLAVLSACRHVGLVKDGMELFDKMKLGLGIEPEIDHYVVVVDMLARYGHLKEAEKLIMGMNIPPNALIWRSFLEGCKKQRNTEHVVLAA